MQRTLFSKCRFTASILAGILTCCTAHAGEDKDPLGRAWGKKITHHDGTLTNSKKDADANMITEDTFDESEKLAVRRTFYLDVAGNLRRGIIFDGMGTPKASTMYDYRGNTLVEEQMFDAKGRLIRRLFPPGVLPGVPANQKRSIAVTIDPETQKEVTREATDARPVQPITEAQEKFNPGIDMGRPLSNDRIEMPKTPNNKAPTPPTGRKLSLLPQRAK